MAFPIQRLRRLRQHEAFRRAVDAPDASAIGKAIGKTVTTVPVTVEAARQSMAQMGRDDWMVNLMCDYFTAYSHNCGDVTTSPRNGQAPRTIEQFAKGFASAFGKQ